MRTLAWSFAGLGLLSGAALLAAPFLVSSTCCGNGGNARATLRGLAAAQLDFRDHDRDGDGRRAFWRGDVAGLYNLCPPGTNEPLKFIEISAAAADLAPLRAVADDIEAPKAGHWYATLRFEDETEGEPDPERFAVCAVPDTLSAGKIVYAVTHEGVLWEAQARCARDVPRAFPLDPEKAGWRRRSP